jgi:hypothetical protein
LVLRKKRLVVMILLLKCSNGPMIRNDCPDTDMSRKSRLVVRAAQFSRLQRHYLGFHNQIVQQNDGDAATTTPTDPEQTALRDTMGRILFFSLCTSQPWWNSFPNPTVVKYFAGILPSLYNPWQLLQYCDFETNMYNAANTAAITGMVG